MRIVILTSSHAETYSFAFWVYFPPIYLPYIVPRLDVTRRDALNPGVVCKLLKPNLLEETEVVVTFWRLLAILTSQSCSISVATAVHPSVTTIMIHEISSKVS